MFKLPSDDDPIEVSEYYTRSALLSLAAYMVWKFPYLSVLSTSPLL